MLQPVDPEARRGFPGPAEGERRGLRRGGDPLRLPGEEADAARAEPLPLEVRPGAKTRSAGSSRKVLVLEVVSLLKVRE